MNIVIRNYLSGSFLLEQEPETWDAIVILDSGLSPTDFVAQYSRKHVFLYFDDVDSQIRGKRPPSTDHVKSALEFAADSENLLVCCRAGQSRSAAIAFVICFQSLGAEAACRLLDPRRHVPNSLIVDLAASLVDEPTLRQVFKNWQSSNRHIKLSDYFDDIEREFDALEMRGARNRIVNS